VHSWYDEAIKATWASPQDVRDQYANASICGNNRVVFNIGGNKFRRATAMPKFKSDALASIHQSSQ
jgi:mRNA interferase HigB